MCPKMYTKTYYEQKKKWKKLCDNEDICIGEVHPYLCHTCIYHTRNLHKYTLHCYRHVHACAEMEQNKFKTGKIGN